jgi:hypothetical protein
MVLTKSELIGSLKHEVRILQHLAGKVDRDKLDYRPTPRQRSTLELLQYLSIMGPELIKAARKGGFDVEGWSAAQKEAAARDFDQTVAAIGQQMDTYPQLLGNMTDNDFRAEIEMFGQKSSVGAFINNLVVCGHAAYRTQLFNYLKACGKEELSTMNLWAGMDPPAA